MVQYEIRSLAQVVSNMLEHPVRGAPSVDEVDWIRSITIGEVLPMVNADLGSRDPFLQELTRQLQCRGVPIPGAESEPPIPGTDIFDAYLVLSHCDRRNRPNADALRVSAIFRETKVVSYRRQS